MSLRLLSWFLLFHSGFGSSCNTKYHVKEACFRNYGTPRDVITNVTSLAMCASLCFEDDSCASVLFDGFKKICFTNSGFAKNLTANCGLKYAYFVQSSCKVLSNLGNVCDTEDDCTDVGSTCLEGLCSCKAGYSLNQSSSTCLQFCDLYGTTFTAFVGFLLTGNNDVILENMNKTSCTAACINTTTFTCRTAELSDDNQCFLSTETAITRPTKYIAYNGYTYFQRNCE
ncbi:uncharacterized protein LOC123553153 [Mercenaria mercenaria]|uniref:uncharacterized protein LOC123553153 n=1 Tax=Mercenaria mercenaria TaxID=6596 RepID=UPI00234FADF3|nr:uncharacterized protein LOC123553153 [Mercenaria mercenaria]